MQLLAGELGKLVDLHVVSHRSAHMLEMPHAKLHLVAGGLAGLRKAKREWQTLIDWLKPNAVHINGCWTPGCALMQKWAKELNCKVVLTPHGMLEPWIVKRHYYTRKLPALWLYQKAAVARADCLQATAESEKQNLLRLGWNDRICVIANGVDVDSISLKTSWKRKKEILFLSRVHVKKGINFLIEAVARLKPEMQGYAVRIAGEGDENYIAELKRLARKRGVADIVSFEGGVYGQRKWNLFRQADLFVLPTHSENFGIVVAEALAAGTPVLTTKGAPWSDLESAHCGWWTEIGTDATVDALKAFLSLTEAELEQMGRNGRRLVLDKYAEAQVAKEMVDMYKKIVL